MVSKDFQNCSDMAGTVGQVCGCKREGRRRDERALDFHQWSVRRKVPPVIFTVAEPWRRAKGTIPPDGLSQKKLCYQTRPLGLKLWPFGPRRTLLLPSQSLCIRAPGYISSSLEKCITIFHLKLHYPVTCSDAFLRF